MTHSKKLIFIIYILDSYNIFFIEILPINLSNIIITIICGLYKNTIRIKESRRIACFKSSEVKYHAVERESDRWLASILKLTCFETHPFHRYQFLNFYYEHIRTLADFFPRAYVEGIRVMLHDILCTTREHRKKF